MPRNKNRVSRLNNNRDTAKEHALIYRKARLGELTLTDAVKYSAILQGHRNILESTQTEERLGKIEERIEVMATRQGSNVVTFRKERAAGGYGD